MSMYDQPYQENFRAKPYQVEANKKMGQMDSLLEEFRNEIDLLEKEICVLEQKLEPVMLNTLAGNSTGEGVAPEPPLCPLAQTIRGMTQHLAGIRRRVERTSSLVQL